MKGAPILGEDMSKTDKVYRTLYERVVGGQLSPGFRLVIDALARDLGVSTMPVREAVRRLEAEGLVRYHPNVGAEVAGVDAHHFMEMHEVLAHLEGLTCRQVQAKFDAGHGDILTALARGMQMAFEDRRLERYVALEGQCHRFLHDLAENHFPGDLTNRLWNRVAPRYLSIYVHVPDSASHPSRSLPAFAIPKGGGSAGVDCPFDGATYASVTQGLS